MDDDRLRQGKLSFEAGYKSKWTISRFLWTRLVALCADETLNGLRMVKNRRRSPFLVRLFKSAEHESFVERRTEPTNWKGQLKIH